MRLLRKRLAGLILFCIYMYINQKSLHNVIVKDTTMRNTL